MDRLPPHSPDAESAIIGSCLSFPTECIPECQRLITDSDFFYDHKNRTVWEHICQAGMPLDAVLVTEKLRASGWLEKVGGAEYLSSCQDKSIGPSFLPGWLSEVSDKFMARKLIFKCSEIISSVYTNGTPIQLLLDHAERGVLSIRGVETKNPLIKELVREALTKIEQRCEYGDRILGLSTGLVDLDKKTDGLHGGEMVVIAAFPSVGKTALAVNIAVRNALSGIPVAIFSAEMRPVQLVVRSICAESRVNFYRANFNDARKLIGPSSKIANAPLHIEQASGFTVGQVVSSARRLKQKYGIKIIVVDYIQRIAGQGDNREREISNISNSLKSMAMELDCCVIALSQLNDDGKLRESRAIGQDADSIWKLENDGDRQPEIQPVKLNVDKCRDGEIGTVLLTFLKTFTRFESASKITPTYDHD